MRETTSSCGSMAVFLVPVAWVLSLEGPGLMVMVEEEATMYALQQALDRKLYEVLASLS